MSTTNPLAPNTVVQEEIGQAALQLPPDEMREFGYAVVDAIVDHLASLREQPTARWADRPTMDARMWQSAPEQGSDPREVLARTVRDVLTDGHRNSHPRYFGYIPNPSNYVGVMADALASGFNIFSGMWMGSPGAAETELLVTDWMRGWCGLPDIGGGILLSGSSMANLVGIATARHARFGHDAEAARRGIVYYSDQAHSSVAKGARMIGIGPDRMRKLPSDRNYRLSIDALAESVRGDRAAGLEPYCVIAAAGTTNTGAIDPLPELADFCGAEGMWLHADGAFGAAAVLSEDGKRQLAGLDRVDSIALDAHKWLFQPIECGCLLVRNVRMLREAFYERPEYLRDADTTDAEVNFSDMGPQLTREFRALKLWMSIQVFGMEAIRAAVERGIALAELAEREIRAAGIWEVITPAQISVLTFRYAPANLSNPRINQLNARIAHATLQDGYAALSTTELRGKTVLRMCITNPRATEAEIRETVRRLGTYAVASLKELERAVHKT
jgi:glutamate/tyrosine decarboxylase-like PLP-dependent enzyme